MPPPALKSLAKKAGKSLSDAERYYSDAKKQRMKATDKKEKGLTSLDYRYIMGVVKKRLGLPTKKVETTSKTTAEFMIGFRLNEADDFNVRVFRDLNGEVSFASLDDVHIDPHTDARVALVHRMANDYQWPHNFPFPEDIEGYEGSVTELARRVIARAFPGISSGA